MNIEYNQESDAVYFTLSENSIVESEEISPGIVYDYDQNNQVVGIEVLKVKLRKPGELKNIQFPFSQAEKAILKEIFTAVLA